MATAPRIETASFPLTSGAQQELIGNLLHLQKAAKKINSILDMGALIDSIVNDIACSFGCLEIDIFLRHETRNEMIAASVQAALFMGRGMP